MQRTLISTALAAAVFAAAGYAGAQVAGSSIVGVEATQLRQVDLGLSAKRQVLGKKVFNDSNQAIGTIDDVVIAPDKSVSYAIVGAGGFLGLDRHDVAIPLARIRAQDGKLVLPGATREALMALPAFQYAS